MSKQYPADEATSPLPAMSRQPGFIAFLGARLAAVFAMQIQAVIVAWQLYDLTHDPMALAYAGLAQFLPMVVLLLPSGDLIDRLPRKPVLMASWSVQLLCSGGLALLSFMPAPPLYPFYTVLVLFGCSRAFTGPALQTLLPQIVPQAQLAQAIAINASIMKIAAIAGPLLGGLLYIAGAGTAYSICFACTLLALLAMFRVPVKQRTTETDAAAHPDPQLGAWQRFIAGLRYIWSRPIILGAISLDLFAVLLGDVVALLPIYAQHILVTGPEGLGALRSASAIGALLMGIYLGRRPINNRVGMIMFSAVILFGICNLVFAVSTLFWLSWLALTAAGAADMVSVYVRSTLIQLATPDHMRGRVNAVNMLFIGSSNELGEFRTGTSAAWFGPEAAAVIGGVTTLGVVALWMRLFPVLRQVSHFEEVESQPGKASQASQ